MPCGHSLNASYHYGALTKMNPSEKLINIDYKTESGLSLILPQLPLFTTKHLALDGIEVQYHQQPAAAMPEHISDKHIVAIYHLQEALSCERFIDGKGKLEHIENGQVIIIPAHVSHKSTWDHIATTILIVVEPEYLTRIAHKSVNKKQLELLPTFAKFDSVIHHLGILLRKELSSEAFPSKLYIEGLTTALLTHLVRQYTSARQPLVDHDGGLPSHILQEALNYIDISLASNLSLKGIASKLGMSHYYFCRLFKQSMGTTPHTYIVQKRIERSRQLLKKKDLTIAQISLECGFANPSHFAKCFRKHMGTSPHQFRLM